MLLAEQGFGDRNAVTALMSEISLRFKFWKFASHVLYICLCTTDT